MAGWPGIPTLTGKIVKSRKRLSRQSLLFLLKSQTSGVISASCLPCRRTMKVPIIKRSYDSIGESGDRSPIPRTRGRHPSTRSKKWSEPFARFTKRNVHNMQSAKSVGGRVLNSSSGSPPLFERDASPLSCSCPLQPA